MVENKTLTISKMKKLALLLGCLLAVTIMHAQEITVAGKSVNYIMGGTLEIYKKDDSSGKKDKMKIDQLHLDSKFEKLIGKDYKKEIFHNDMSFFRDMERITIPGLQLMLPEDKRGDVEFELTTPQYHIVLENGKEIYVGMTADQFSAIFPLSWADRYTLTGYKGKFGVLVVFAYMEQGEIKATDETLFLFIDKKTMKVEQISFNIRP
jgi:hypothetical protein